MFEVLLFLFENYLDRNFILKANNQTIAEELQQIGFKQHEVDCALTWLRSLNGINQTETGCPSPVTLALRHYLAHESEQLGVEGKGFLLYLEQIGILSPLTREAVIDKLMTFHKNDVDLLSIQWTVLMVLYDQLDIKPKSVPRSWLEESTTLH